MKSIFSAADNQEIVYRIQRLGPNSRAEWGKMTVGQMLVHTQRPLRVAFGELKLKRTLIGYLFGNLARKQLASPVPFKKNLPTDGNFIVKTRSDFDLEKKKLTALVQDFVKVGVNGLTKEPHPFFGKLTTEEWDTLTWKHLDHHLRQFGV
jgi:hypothetical protein